MDKRTLLAIVLSLAVIFIYQTYFAPPPPKKPAPAPTQEKGEVKSPETPALLPGEAVLPPGERVKGLADQTKTQREITVDTPLYTAVFTTKGGALKSLKLKNYRKNTAKNSELIELVHLNGAMPRPLSLSFPDSTIDIAPDGMYDTEARDLIRVGESDRPRVIFQQVHPGQVKVEKIYSFDPGKYTFDLEVRLHNLSGNSLSQSAGLSWHQFVDPTVETDSYSHDGPITFISTNIERHQVAKLSETAVLGPNVAWAAFESKYFIASLIASNPTLTNLYLAKDEKDMVTVGLKGPKQIIPPGQVGLFNYSLYLGPKDYEIMKEKGVGLENAIDFSDWLRWLVVPLLMVLKYLYGWVNNYGVAIIILTILIKIIFWPLGNKSYKSMKEMQKLQPKITELRDKYKDDKTKLSQETMALYRLHKVNPLGGCLPVVIQIPVFFGLYKALLYAIELRHAPFIWWITDLSAKDPYYVTPIIMGATMFIQQKMAPPMGDPLQTKIMLFMPVIFTFLFLGFPAGLVIYWLFNNIISIGQQVYINKRPS